MVHSLQFLPIPTALSRFWVVTFLQELPALHLKDFAQGGFSGIPQAVPTARLERIMFASYSVQYSYVYNLGCTLILAYC